MLWSVSSVFFQKLHSFRAQVQFCDSLRVYFLYKVRGGSGGFSFSLLHVDTQFSQHHLLKTPFFLQHIRCVILGTSCFPVVCMSFSMSIACYYGYSISVVCLEIVYYSFYSKGCWLPGSILCLGVIFLFVYSHSEKTFASTLMGRQGLH